MSWLVGMVLLLAATLAVWRRGERRAAPVLLQLLSALLLFFCLFPPATRESFHADELLVLTPGVTAGQLASVSPLTERVALPGVPTGVAAPRVPDLATALRQRPQLHRLHVLGHGLPARDRDAARGLSLRFDPAPLPRGLMQLDAPFQVRSGQRVVLRGRVEQMAGGGIELHDPAGTVVASQELDAAGGFALAIGVKMPGRALFSLELHNGDGSVFDTVPMPLQVLPSRTARLLLLAGAPDPELKYLRRWAVDAGLELHSRITLTEDIPLTEGEPEVPAFADVDLVILDQSAWAGLDESQKTDLLAAVTGGLGLLLRITGELPDKVADDWRALGFPFEDVEAGAELSLRRSLAADAATPPLHLHGVDLLTDGVSPLWQADGGEALGWYGNRGEGRLAAWRVADSYRLQLADQPATFGSLWAELVHRLARADEVRDARGSPRGRVGERVVFCGVAEPVRVVSDTGNTTPLIPRADGCAAFWPADAGWHRLIDPAQQQAFHVLDSDSATALASADAQRATRALVNGGAASAPVQRPHPLPRWPFFLAWLAAVGLLWRLERRR